MQEEIVLQQNSLQKGKGQSGSFRLLLRLASISRKYMLWYVALMIVSLLVSVIGLLDTQGFRWIINAATNKDHPLLYQGLILCVIVLVLGQLLEFFKGYFTEMLDFTSVRNLQSGLVHKMTRILMKQYDRYHTGDLSDRINNSAPQAQAGLNNHAVNILQNGILLVLTLIYLLTINIKMTLASMGFAIILPLLVNPLSKRLRQLHENGQQLHAEKSAFIQDTVQGAEVVRTYLLTDSMSRHLQDIYRRIISNVKKLLPLEGFMGSAHVLVIISGDFFVMGFGGYLVSKGELQVGDVMAFLLLFERLFGPLAYLSTIWPFFQSALTAAGRVFEIMDLPEEPQQQTLIAPANGDIIMENVTFRYREGEREILKELSFYAGQGTVTAIVGPSGSGKSTVLKLLLGLYSPDAGRICFGGMPLQEMSLDDWRSHIAYASQEPCLFQGSIGENIALAKPGASQQDIEAAAKAANIHSFILQSEKDYDTLIGEKGIKLSGGERQRLSIARAILMNPQVLVLDEPTSSLDQQNEREVLQALNELMHNRTTLVVAHRLSTIQNAGQILYMENGTILETGTHEELMQKKGRYCSMYLRMKEGEEQ